MRAACKGHPHCVQYHTSFMDTENLYVCIWPAAVVELVTGSGPGSGALASAGQLLDAGARVSYHTTPHHCLTDVPPGTL
jgi:hypothetical protein